MRNFIKGIARAVGLLVLCGVATSAAAQTVGVYEPVELTREDQELIAVSGEFGNQIERRGMLHPDEGLQDYVAAVGARIAPPPTDSYVDYRFFVLRDRTANAFALADGQIYVHTGMLARLENEAQLAALLAHEVNHVAGHHGVLARRTYKKQAIAAQVVGGLLGAFGGEWGGVFAALSDVGFSLAIFGYSRELESDADHHATDRLLVAGYDVRELPRIFEIMEHDPEGERAAVRTKWSTHPDLTARAEITRARAREFHPDIIDSLGLGAEDFDERMQLVRLATLRDYIDADYPRTALALLADLLAARPDDVQLHVARGDAWLAMGARDAFGAEEEPDDADKRRNARQRSRLTRQQRQEKLLKTEAGQRAFQENLQRAGESFQQALSIAPDYAPAYRGLGEMHQASGQADEAGRAYLRYLKLAPQADDRAVVVSRLRHIRTQLQQTQLQQTRSDP